MADVIDFSSRRLEQEPHISGPVTCLACSHEWAAVVPVGTVGIECPQCGLAKGVHKYLCMPDDGIIWQCNCGNKLFVVSALGNAICVNCGQHHNTAE